MKNLSLLLAFLLLSFAFTQESLGDLREHIDSVCQEPDHKHYEKTTMAYITPW